jgi:plastocyanin
MRSPLRWLAVFPVIAILFAAAACDDESDKPTPVPGVVTQTPNAVPSVGAPQDQPTPAQELSANAIEPKDGVVEMTASGTRYKDNRVQVTPGEAVVIRLTNQDTTAHNLRIAGVDGQFETEDDAITTPDAIEGGQAGELTFASPAQGAYTFRCDFHPDSMGGVILVGDARPPG